MDSREVDEDEDEGHAETVTLFKRAVDLGVLFRRSSPVRTQDGGPDNDDGADGHLPMGHPWTMALALNQWNTLHNLHRVTKTIEGQVEEVKAMAPQYDPYIGVKSNGYRSFVKISGMASHRALTVLKRICPDLEKRLQRWSPRSEVLVEVQDRGDHDDDEDHDQQHTVWSHSKATSYRGLKLRFQVRGDDTKAWEDLAYWGEYLKKLSRMLSLLLEIGRSNEPGELMPSVPDLRQNPLLFQVGEALGHEDFAVFYDPRGLGLYLKDSVRFLVKQLQLLQGLFADVYHGSILCRVARIVRNFFGIRYWLDPTALGETVYLNARDSPVGFCKQFFGMSEYEVSAMFMKIGAQPVRTNHLIRLEADQCIRVQTSGGDGGGSVPVPPPTSHFGKRPFNVRLISPFGSAAGSRCARCLLVCRCRPEDQEQQQQQEHPCRTIMFHVHGGGFVSQTSKSHESYLRYWAVKLGIPILSVDYSLSPEGSYPRPVEETLYAYAWMRNNFRLLGTTGENVILAGDSAGGNLVAGLAVNCIRLGIPGASSMALFYPSLLVQVFPSPSRIVCMMDPLVMFPFMLRCSNAYVLGTRRDSRIRRSFHDELQDSVVSNHDPLISPFMADDSILSQFPPTYLFSTDVDLCLDECIVFANKLKRVNVPVNLKVYKSLPHGFLSLNLMSKDCQAAVDNVTKHLTDLLRL